MRYVKRRMRTPETDRELAVVRRRRYAKKHPGRERWRHLVRRAQKHNVAYMNCDDFCDWFRAIEKVCCYCGMDEANARAKFKHALHIDRKDGAGGYETGNICLACHRCNVVKNGYLTHDQMREVAARYFNGAHDELVAALERFVSLCPSAEGLGGHAPMGAFTLAADIARAALAKAKGTT